MAFRFTQLLGKSSRDIERAQLVVLNPHELVYLRDPVETSYRYGKDSSILPRSRIRAVQVREKNLEICSNGVRFSLSMTPELCQAAAQWLP